MEISLSATVLIKNASVDEIELIVDFMMSLDSDCAEKTHQINVIWDQTGTTFGVPTVPADITQL